MPNTSDADYLAQLVEEVRNGAKYRDISPDLVRRIAARELLKRQSRKETVKAVRNKLHQVAGAYLDGREGYDACLVELRACVEAGDQVGVQRICKTMMATHASTRERLPILERFYTMLLSEVGPVRSILDLACGLNPLALPWMPLEGEVDYYAYDIYQRMIDFLNAALPLLGVHGQAQVCDIIQDCPDQRVDVAFVLKTIPCLEQADKEAGQQLLRTLNAAHIVISFPVSSLGGRSKGMAAYYEQHFRKMIEGEAWQVRRYEFETELAFIVNRC